MCNFGTGRPIFKFLGSIPLKIQFCRSINYFSADAPAELIILFGHFFKAPIFGGWISDGSRFQFIRPRPLKLWASQSVSGFETVNRPITNSIPLPPSCLSKAHSHSTVCLQKRFGNETSLIEP